MSKTLKSVLFVLVSVVFGLGGGFYFFISSDSDSHSVYWQKAFPYLSGFCFIVLFIGGIICYNATKQKN